METNGGKVRIRNIQYPVPIAADIEGRGLIRVVIQPNVWTELPPELYRIAKAKFEEPRYREVPDSLPDPEGRYHGVSGHTRLEDVTPYIMEFRDNQSNQASEKEKT